ncbi:DUF4913 domain-containing protein [Brachybacterium sp. UNK5269]|uniref:DUF4913 domain-containing protein n=1 Tax=Brachybacterium sp. UNK5269 TaxID=3408576 RepID=UPI003BB033F7
MSESDWGEDSWEVPPPLEEETAAPAGASVPAGLEVAGAAAEAVDAAVKSAVRKEVAAIATQAVADALTEELVEQLREQAQASAAAAVEEQLSPPAPEPEEPATGEDEEKPPELVYGSVDEFVREYLRHVYRRQTSDHRVWAARWWEYDEAVIRLEALWRAWEHLRLDPSTGMSVWWRDHADHHMAVLMDPEGPFASAERYGDENEALKGAPLPYEAPPEGLFPDARELTVVKPAYRPEQPPPSPKN